MANVPCDIIIRDGDVACKLAKIYEYIHGDGPESRRARAEIRGFDRMTLDYLSDTLVADTVATWVVDGEPTGALAAFLELRNETIPFLVEVIAEMEGGAHPGAYGSYHDISDRVHAMSEALDEVRAPMVDPL